MAKAQTEVVRALEEAFVEVPRGEITIHQAEVIDLYGTRSEETTAREADRETDWRLVPDLSIEECPDALSYLDPAAWRFYIPAYMRWTACHVQTTDSTIVNNTIYSLGDRLTESRYSMLAAAEVSAVCEFLEFMADKRGLCDSLAAADALESYRQPRRRLTSR